MRHRSPLILRGGLLILGCALVAAPVWGDEVTTADHQRRRAG
jgi:hypothetical protein